MNLPYLALFLLFKISVIQDIPYFITGNFVHYQGFVELHNAKDTSVHFNDKSNRYKIGSYTKRVLYLDNQDIIATRKRTNIIANLKLNKGVIKSDSKYKNLVSIVPNETQDFVMKDAKGSEKGDILYVFNGSVSRQLYYLQDGNKDTFKNGDSNTITGGVILFPSKDYATLPIPLYTGKGLGNDKDFDKILKFDLPCLVLDTLSSKMK